jgi:hypothetical protein
MLDLSLYLAKKQCCGAVNISYWLWLRRAITPNYSSGSGFSSYANICLIYLK